jgi:predicted Zn-dependent protease
LTAFDAELALVPGRPSLRANRGAALCRLARWSQAVPALQAAVQADPDHAEAWAALGLAQEALGQWSAAADGLQRAMAMAMALGLRCAVLC